MFCEVVNRPISQGAKNKQKGGLLTRLTAVFPSFAAFFGMMRKEIVVRLLHGREAVVAVGAGEDERGLFFGRLVAALSPFEEGDALHLLRSQIAALRERRLLNPDATPAEEDLGAHPATADGADE